MEQDLSFRLATPVDLDAVVAIYDAIHDLEERGKLSIGWQRGVYPTRATAAEAIGAGELYVALDGGEVVASGRMNHCQEDAYRAGSWSCDADDPQVLVLHTLTVAPGVARRGIGTRFVEFYERRARELGCMALRIDTQEKNAAARRLYARLGFSEVGIVDTDFQSMPGIRLVLLEKVLA